VFFVLLQNAKNAKNSSSSSSTTQQRSSSLPPCCRNFRGSSIKKILFQYLANRGSTLKKAFQTHYQFTRVCTVGKVFLGDDINA
jgi:hypothetical protein